MIALRVPSRSFGGAVLEVVPFPGGPWDVPNEIGNGRPLIVVLSYEGCTVGASVEAVPDLIARIYERKRAEGGSLRQFRNNLVFIVADESRIEEMRRKMARRLALNELKKPERIAELAEHQQVKVRELEGKSEAEVAISIQQCFRHLFYPSRNRIIGASIDLAHSALDIHSASEKPGAGQQQVVRSLRDLHKLRTQEDEPDAPAYVRDRTPLKRGQITTAALRVGCTLQQAEIEAIEKGEELRQRVDRHLTAMPLMPTDPGMAEALELLAWLVAQGRLEIR
jgi:hypothetical protein